jgi:hypothetical protein
MFQIETVDKKSAAKIRPIGGGNDPNPPKDREH